MSKFTITHTPSGDEAEADSLDAAFLAATTLIRDNDTTGQSRIVMTSPSVAFFGAVATVYAAAVRHDDEERP